MIRLAIDAHTLGTGAGGNESYIRALLDALSSPASDIAPMALTPPGWREELPAGIASQPLRTQRSWLRVALDLPSLLRRGGFDLFHAQYLVPPACPCPAVVSIHDFVWKRHPETLPPLVRYRLQALIPATLRRARRVFVLCEAMRQELRDLYDFPPDRIDIVPPAVHPRFHAVIEAEAVDRVRTRHRLPPEYVLYVGALQPRKNLNRLLEAFAAVRREGLPHRLAMVGQEAWMARPLRETIRRLRLEDAIVFTGYVLDADLPALYRGAAGFAYVSIYEGFGIPVAEALACGTPVLTSNSGALAEVAGDAALTCDPFDVDALADGLRTLLTDPELRQRLRDAGPGRARVFSHEAMRTAACQGYRRAVEDAGRLNN
ncbi:MAG: glycosyltransferase family 4 protein [Candidatus Hydrogenedentales bacterium]